MSIVKNHQIYCWKNKKKPFEKIIKLSFCRIFWSFKLFEIIVFLFSHQTIDSTNFTICFSLFFLIFLYFLLFFDIFGIFPILYFQLKNIQNRQKCFTFTIFSIFLYIFSFFSCRTQIKLHSKKSLDKWKYQQLFWNVPFYSSFLRILKIGNFTKFLVFQMCNWQKWTLLLKVQKYARTMKDFAS